MNKILQTDIGSKLYGTNTKDSDTDLASIFVASKNNYLGLDRIEKMDLSNVSKDINNKNKPDAVDHISYELLYFCKLALSGNPNIFEILFTNTNSLWKITNHGLEVLNNRFYFVSKLLYKKFKGFSFSQLKRFKRENFNNFKLAMNSLRMLLQLEELLDSCSLSYPLKDFEYLLKVKQGIIPVNIILDDIEYLENICERKFDTTYLNEKPDYNKINNMCIKIIEETIYE